MSPSVMIPSVPSAPIKSLVVSNPADDFLARRLVLITSPLGRTTVLKESGTKYLWLSTHCVEKPFGFGCTVSNLRKGESFTA